MEKEKLHRFFAGTTSIQEGMDIRAWMEASEENKRIFYKERKLFDALMVHDDQTTNNCISTKRIPKIIRQWLKIASVIILTLTINYLYQKYKSENEVIAMNTVSVPAGQRTNITLPDGTNVWLNARTTLQYPVTFSQKQRTVFLKGEAYFDVTKKKKTPFIVRTDKYDIEVLGTQFDVVWTAARKASSVHSIKSRPPPPCTWISTPPGTTYIPLTSISSAPITARSQFVTSKILLSLISTEPSFIHPWGVSIRALINWVNIRVMS